MNVERETKQRRVANENPAFSKSVSENGKVSNLSQSHTGNPQRP